MSAKVKRSLFVVAVPLAIVVGLTVAAIVRGQAYVNNGAASPSPGQGLVVNGTSQTITLPSPVATVTVRSAGSSDPTASTAVTCARALCCGAPLASPSPDVTCANGIPIAPGQWYSFSGPRSECKGYPSGLYCGVALVVYPSPSPSPAARAFISGE